MNRIPIVFAFDNNLVMPAAVCMYSLFVHALPTTMYQVYVLHRKGEHLDTTYMNKVFAVFTTHTLTLVEVGDTFDTSFEIRGITTPAYYRLLIPNLIPEHDRVIYSDVDVIFRQDLSDLYLNEDLTGCYIAGVNNLAHIDKDLNAHYEGTLRLDPLNVICSGFLIMDSRKIREMRLVNKFINKSRNKYKFQDQDVLNIVCSRHIKHLAPKYSVLTYISEYFVRTPELLANLWSKEEISEAMAIGNIHYNGQKPWKGYCINFDVWWEYYRKSPIFDEDYYFKFFYNKLEELDTLSLKKRIKNLLRYFVYGKKSLI